jgi:sulfur carrier protein ThiS
MRVQVRLGGWLDHRLPGGRGEVDVPDGTTVSEILDRLRIVPGPCVYVVNGVLVGYDHPLSDGDEVSISRMASGG